jgi:hypothetical protein
VCDTVRSAEWELEEHCSSAAPAPPPAQELPLRRLYDALLHPFRALYDAFRALYDASTRALIETFGGGGAKNLKCSGPSSGPETPPRCVGLALLCILVRLTPRELDSKPRVRRCKVVGFQVRKLSPDKVGPRWPPHASRSLGQALEGAVFGRGMP